MTTDNISADPCLSVKSVVKNSDAHAHVRAPLPRLFLVTFTLPFTLTFTPLAPLGRPLDLHQSGRGKIYVLEYSRGTKNGVSYTPPGRILELAVAGK